MSGGQEKGGKSILQRIYYAIDIKVFAMDLGNAKSAVIVTVFF